MSQTRTKVEIRIAYNCSVIRLFFNPQIRQRLCFLNWMYHMFRRFGMGKKSMEEKILEEAEYLNDELLKQNGKPFDNAVS